MKKLLKISLTLVITVILVTGIIMPEIIMGTPASTAVGNWYQQFLPNLNGAQVTDMTFIDSLTGYIVTSIGGSNSNILKTTNGGDSWTVKFTHTQAFVKVKFINANTGFTNAFTTIFKTTNAGENWTPINLPGIFGDDMFVLNQDTIWLAMSETFTGGVYRTTNGGSSWDHQLNIGSLNPTNVYFYNGTTGYISYNGGGAYVRRTTNSGVNWTVNVNGEGFTDMHFADALTGYRSYGTMKKTTDGGLSWVNQVLPSGGMINLSQIVRFSVLNKDTIFAVGGRIGYPNNQMRGMIYRTINGGGNWTFQVPDTAYNIFIFNFIKFTSKLNGWAYSGGMNNLHTTTGGDPVWLTAIEQISCEVPKEFMLYQNYPNPFNPVTNIGFRIAGFGLVTLTIFDITGREAITLINEELRAGEYKTDWNAFSYSSGVYFYRLTVTSGKEVFTDTKRMVLIK